MSAGKTGNLLFITDTKTGRRFLCDTGAQLSVIPTSVGEKYAAQCGPALVAANGSSIRTFGSRNVALCFGGQCFRWDIVTAIVPTALRTCVCVENHFPLMC